MANLNLLSTELRSVTTVHDRQRSTLNRKETILNEHRQKYRRDTERLRKSVEENYLRDEKLTSIRINNFKAKEQNENVDMEIAASLKRANQTKRKLAEVKFTRDEINSKLNNEERKMLKFAEKLNEDVSTDKLYLSASNQTQLLENLSSQKARSLVEIGLTVTSDSDINKNFANKAEETELLRSANDFLRSECARKENEIKEVSNERVNILRDIVLIEKHNAARLLRLKRQLSEARESTTETVPSVTFTKWNKK